MNIFLFVNYTPDDKSIGITKKISSEIKALREMGHFVTYTAYKSDGIYIFNNNNDVVYKKQFRFKNKFIISFLRYFVLLKTIKKYINCSNNSYDLLYARLLPLTKGFFEIIRSFKNNKSKVVVESLAYFPGIKFRSIKGKYISFLLKKNGPRLKGLVDTVLTEGHLDSFYGVSDIREMSMGVQTDEIVPHRYEGKKDELHLISVANEMPYHAYDRVIKSLRNFYLSNKKRKVFIHLVGLMTKKTIRMINRFHLDNYVLLYGKKSGIELDEIYKKCNLGLGPLGQHRVGGKKDTGLKTKEYFARGIPYIYSGEEPTVPANYPYVLSIPSDESDIDFDCVWDFYISYRDNENVVSEMRKFAFEHYSWIEIMKKAIGDSK